MADAKEIERKGELADPWSIPLEELDPSDARLFQSGQHLDYFERLRKEDPVHWYESEAFGGFWSVTKFADIMAVDRNHKAFSSEPTIVIGDLGEEVPITQFIAKDPPIHDEQRKAVNPAVAPTQLADLESLIKERVAKVLDSLPVDEEFDWVDRVSIEITTQMLATLFDFPWEDRRLLPYWSDVATSFDGVGSTARTAEERQQILMECLEYFQKLWVERAAQPRKFDFISLMAHDPKTKDMVNNPMDFLGNILLLIVGGNDTTRNSMTGGVYFLNKYPEEFAKLKADPSLIPNMVSEIIHYQTPLGHMRRTASQDIELGGKQIKKGDKVVMWYVSGNRDEEAIENPDQFIIDRDRARQHLSFGFGIHRCMGNRVAEMQLRILWEEILKRFDDVKVVGEPKRVQSNFVLGYETMPVKLVKKGA